MWERIKAFIGHLFRNIIKVVVLIGVIAMLFTLTPEQVADEPLIGLFFIFLLTIDVVTVYDFGDFVVIASEAGASLVAALILYFLVAAFISFLLQHAAIVAGILLLLYAINRGIEVYKYYDLLPMFFTITGGLVAITVLVNSIFFFIGGPTAVPQFLYVIDLIAGVAEVINIIARATQADCDDSHRTTAYKT